MNNILKDIELYKNKEKAKLLSRFFKTGIGEYGEGDIFWGLAVPTSRKIALKYKNISLSEISFLLKNKVHEVRLIGVLILINKYQKSNLQEKKKIVNFYLKNIKYINNWDLVDLSAPKILGDYLLNKKDRKILLKLSNSKNLWKERISILATFSFIRVLDFKWSFYLAQKFLNHKHDLIHKACGWMLREIGKKDEKKLKEFLDKYISIIPRTMLRYAIEKFKEKERKIYLKK